MILSSRPYINTGFPTLKSEATTEEGSLDLLRKHLCFDKTMWFDDEGGGWGKVGQGRRRKERSLYAGTVREQVMGDRQVHACKKKKQIGAHRMLHLRNNFQKKTDKKKNKKTL